jgi:hypothetical protein
MCHRREIEQNPQGIGNFNLQNDSTFASENKDKKVFNK